MNARCDCDTHDSHLSAVYGKSLSTKCVHTYKAVPNHHQFELLVRELPQSVEGDLASGVCIPHTTDVVSLWYEYNCMCDA